jgi:hypothetical protein
MQKPEGPGKKFHCTLRVEHVDDWLDQDHVLSAEVEGRWLPWNESANFGFSRVSLGRAGNMVRL